MSFSCQCCEEDGIQYYAVMLQQIQSILLLKLQNATFGSQACDRMSLDDNPHCSTQLPFCLLCYGLSSPLGMKLQ